MSILNNIRNRVGDAIKTKPNRSFESLTNSTQQTGCSYVSQGSKFYQIHKTSESLADHPTFSNSYNLIKNKIYAGDTFVSSIYKDISISLTNELEEIGFNKETRVKIFDILYKGSGACLCLIENSKLRVLPFFEGEELVKIKWNRYKDKIISIAIRSDDPHDHNWYYLDLENTDYYILHNIQQGDTYKSNLTIAAPYIVLSNALLNRDIEFANDSFNGKPIITPNIDKLVVSSGVTEIVHGGETMPISQFLTKNIWGNIRNEINEKLKHDKLPILPFDVNIKSLTQNNSQNQTNLIRDYADSMIVRASHSSGSVLGQTGSNRAESEQQRDNFDQQVIKLFQEMVCRVANDFLIPLLAPESKKRFEYKYYSEETDESIQLRDQQLELAKLLISPDFITFKQANNLELDTKQVAELFNSTHGLKLIDQIQNVEEYTDHDVGDTITNPSNRAFSFEDSIRKISIETLDFSDIESKREFKSKVVNILDRALKAQLQAVRRANNIRADIGSDDVSKYLKPEMLKKLLNEVAGLTLDEYIQKTGSSLQALPKTVDDLIDSLVKLHFEGGEVLNIDKDGNTVTNQYAGYSSTNKELLAKYSAKDLSNTKIQELVNNQVQSITNNLFLPLFGETYQSLAVEDGADYVGTVAKNDQLVRGWHLANSGYAWKIGSNPPDSTNREFYLERYCRCSRVYGTKDQLQRGGFKIYN